MALGAIELVDSSGIVLNPKGAAIQPTAPQGPGALDKMSPMETMQEVFFDIRDGITNLGEIFREKISGLNSHLAYRLETLNTTMSKIGTVAADDFALQEKAFADEQADQRQDERGENLGDQDVPTDTGGEKSGFTLPSFSLPKMPDVGPKGKLAIFSLIAAGLFAFADKITAVVAPALKFLKEEVFPKIKMFFNIIKEDIGPIFQNIIDFFKEAFDGVGDLLKGAFEGDATLFLTGVKKIFLDLPIRFISIIGDAFFSLADAALKALGIDAPYVEDIAQAFRELPEAIDKAIQATIDFFVITIPKKFNEIIDFFTETIPTKLGEMRDNIMTGISDMISFIVDPIVQLKDDIVDTVDVGIDKIKDGIVSVVTSVKDTFANFVNGLKSMANAIIDKINLIPGVNIDKLEMTPLSDDKIEVVGETGDATIAEGIALDNRARVEGNAARARNYTSSMRTVTQSGGDNYDFMDEEFALEMEKADQVRAQKLQTLLDNTLQNQELRANAETSKPIIVANSTKQGDVTNQTSVHSAEPASDHSDLTAKALADAMSA